MKRASACTLNRGKGVAQPDAPRGNTPLVAFASREPGSERREGSGAMQDRTRQGKKVFADIRKGAYNRKGGDVSGGV